MNYEEAVNKIINTPRVTGSKEKLNKSGNSNLGKVMELLGNPHMSVPSIHIAGTNGKGSTCQFVKGILCASGYKVGVFTSPHILKINERIEMAYGFDGCKINSSYISDSDFLLCYERVCRAMEENINTGGLPLSFFEIIFAMAAVYFQEKEPDYVIYETGLGGRLDATNLIEPVITAITSIGLDHTEYLGDTIEAVAGEKAGIIKTNIPVIYNTGDKSADLIIEKTAFSKNAEAINVAKTNYIINEITHKSIDFSLCNSYYKYEKLIIPVTGALYQVDNAVTAITLCNRLLKADNCINIGTIQKGLQSFFWQGRMESIHPKIILDGAHNPDAIERFVESALPIATENNISLLFAVAGDKDYRPMIETLCRKLPLCRVYVTSINSNRGISAKYTAEIFSQCLKKNACTVMWDDDIKVMFETAFKDIKNTDETLFCVGSLYLVSSIKEIAREVLI